MKIKVLELDIADGAKSLSELVGQHLCVSKMLIGLLTAGDVYFGSSDVSDANGIKIPSVSTVVNLVKFEFEDKDDLMNSIYLRAYQNNDQKVFIILW